MYSSGNHLYIYLDFVTHQCKTFIHSESPEKLLIRNVGFIFLLILAPKTKPIN